MENGNSVYGIEPNEPMRKAAEGWLNAFEKFISLHGSAEQTTLQDNSIDLIVCAQAFHWLDRKKLNPNLNVLQKKMHTYV